LDVSALADAAGHAILAEGARREGATLGASRLRRLGKFEEVVEIGLDRMGGGRESEAGENDGGRRAEKKR
ncbi:hypothetical protein, partial [Escherichia fergusonii]|uniref:hypothetical protein n=1 Tax=Escherichia fergusonii TaxID=564 RepID=UPI001CC1834D